MAEPWIGLEESLSASLSQGFWPTFSTSFCDANCFGIPVNGALSVTAVLAGATVAYLARRYPRYHDILERIGGILLVCGFSLLGYSLEVVLGTPAP